MERSEIVAAFSNAAFLLFVGLFIAFEAVEHMFEGPEEDYILYGLTHFTPFPPKLPLLTPTHSSTSVAVIGVLGLIVHILAVVFFREQITMRSEIAIPPRQQGMERIVIDAFLNAAPSIGVIISTSLIHIRYRLALAQNLNSKTEPTHYV